MLDGTGTQITSETKVGRTLKKSAETYAELRRKYFSNTVTQRKPFTTHTATATETTPGAAAHWDLCMDQMNEFHRSRLNKLFAYVVLNEFNSPHIIRRVRPYDSLSLEKVKKFKKGLTE